MPAALHAVRFTRGVTGVVSTADRPIAIDDDIIATIRERIGADGLVELDAGIGAGDRVTIVEGPFQGIEGVFQRSLNEHQRVAVLLNIVQGSITLNLPRTALRKTSK